MSLILEALRKSEAQRRLGQAPDLHSPVIATTPRTGLPRWLLPALGLMLVGALAWGLGRMAVPNPSNGTETEAVVTPTPLPSEIDLAPAPPTPDAGPQAAPATRVPTPPAEPARVEPARVEAPTPAPAAVVTRDPAPAPEATPPEQSAPPAAVAAVPATAPPATSADPAADGPRTAQPAMPDEDLLRLADLPAATRASLPALRISMHVYSEQPARRFAIIDGRRVAEGGLLEGQGVVEAIRRDGIVVDFDGRRVMLPRP